MILIAEIKKECEAVDLSRPQDAAVRLQPGTWLQFVLSTSREPAVFTHGGKLHCMSQSYLCEGTGIDPAILDRNLEAGVLTHFELDGMCCQFQRIGDDKRGCGLPEAIPAALSREQCGRKSQ